MRLYITIALLATPAVFSAVLRMLWQNVPARIPTHWGVSGPADSFSDSTTAWLVCLAFAVGALVAGIDIILLGADITVFSRSSARR